MKLKIKKKLAGHILKTSYRNVKLNSDSLEDIKKAVTKDDIRSLINNKIIKEKKIKGSSKSRIRKNALQKKKGRRRGEGSRKGGKNSKVTKKRRWINHIRIQRKLLKYLRDKEVIDKASYRSLYLKCKGGFFRSKRHLNMYLHEKNLILKK